VRNPPFELSGIDLFENRFIIPGRFRILNELLKVERVVDPDAQTSYFGAPRVVPNTDHFSVVKPTDAEHPSHRYLVDYVMHVFAKSKA
jgi:hypothetical protein